MAANPLLRLRELGQSVWLDYIQRDLIVSGGLARLIREDGLVGVTSNPAIFEKAITRGYDYEAPIRKLARRGRERQRHTALQRRALPARLAAFGIDLGEVARELEEEAIRKFVEPYDKILATLEQGQRQREAAG